ncbi:MAG: MBL fold metallo-hydrolase [bacterium]
MEVKLESIPLDDEIEVSIFGPGYGESVVVHVGEGEWIIVDSCIDPIVKKPNPLTYLQQLGVNPAKAVKQIIATHWHDDHIRGLGKIVRECNSAEFVCSGALTTKEFLTLVRAYGAHTMMKSSGVQEFYEIINSLKERKHIKNDLIPPKFASADRCLWQRSQNDLEGRRCCAIYALSPSDTSILQSKLEIEKFIPHYGETKKRIALFPNYLAVVLWIKIGSIYILLGSDLEEFGNPRTGWSAIVTSKTRPKGRASLFKLPHHGSSTADHPKVWEEMLKANPIAVLTPFIKGKTLLPTKQDIERIYARTDQAYATSTFMHKSKTKRPNIVTKQVKEIVRSIHTVPSSKGQIRIRIKIEDKNLPCKAELFGDAIPLNQFYHI